MEINEKDFEDLVIYSLRYTFGRMTYSASHVIDIIKKHVKRLSFKAKAVLIADIKTALKDHERGIKIGMDMDKVLYQELLHHLEKDDLERLGAGRIRD